MCAARWRNANVRQVTKPAELAGRVFTLADIGPINVLEAGPELAAHRHSPYPPLADRRVRYVGQTIAACMMPTRAQAEDLADQVNVELEELPAVVDAVAAMRADSPRVFDEWPNNAYISTTVVEGNPESLSLGADPPTAPAPAESPSDRLARRTGRARLLGLSA